MRIRSLRRRNFILFVAGLALLSGAAWYFLDSPLSPVEKRLVGTWSTRIGLNTPNAVELRMELRSDRTVRISGASLTATPLPPQSRPMLGEWRVENGKLGCDWRFVESSTGITDEMGQKRRTTWERITQGRPETKDWSEIDSVTESELRLRHLDDLRIWTRVD